MAMNKHKLSENGGVDAGGVGGGSGGLTPSGTDSQTDLLAGLELGKKSSVSYILFLLWKRGRELMVGLVI